MTLWTGVADMQGQVAAAVRESGEARGRGRCALGHKLGCARALGEGGRDWAGWAAKLSRPGLRGLPSSLFFSVFLFLFPFLLYALHMCI